MSWKNISFILCLAVISFVFMAALSQAGTNNDIENVSSKANARISLVLADDGKEQKSYRWGLTRNMPLNVVHGWFAFDDKAILEHGGVGTENAETKPMQISLQILKNEGYLVLNRNNEFSGNIGNQPAKTQWPENADLKCYYLSESVELTDKLQPLWKGEFILEGKVVKSVVYAMRIVSENESNDLFDVKDASDTLKIGKEWARHPTRQS